MLRRLGAPHLGLNLGASYRTASARSTFTPICPEEIEVNDAASTPWPTELRLHKDRKALTIAFDNGETFDLSAEYLRVRSPSAEVKGHSPDERKTVAGKKDVAILEVNP